MASLTELTATIADLETRLAAAEAVQEIQRLKARYSALIDERYTRAGPKSPAELARIADAAAQLFAPDAVWDAGRRLGRWQGRGAIRERFLAPTLKFTLHYFLNPVIEVTGDTARGRWDILAPITFDDGRPGWMAGIEHDEYVRHEGRWLHSSMQLTIHFTAPELGGWDQRAPR
jgi:hypothetical protein